jgi:putative ABC transport system ATP-binding protein
MKVLKIFQDIHAKGQTIVMVTHEAEYAKVADRVIEMIDGMVS